jgi:hypothetical protein
MHTRVCALLLIACSAPVATRPAAGVLFYAKYGSEDQTAPLDDPSVAGALFQIYWSEVEPEEGAFVWEALDARIARWRDAGKHVALRVMWSASGRWPDPAAEHPTPDWVIARGAVVAHRNDGTDIPLFWDPIYLEHALRFVGEIDRRYGGDDTVLFLDVTPGAETNPYRFGTGDTADAEFETLFRNTPASDGSIYSDELWAATLVQWLEALSENHSIPFLVTLNRGSFSDGAARLEATGDRGAELGYYLGQNGLRGTTQPSGRWLEWAEQTPLFFEMLRGTGTDVGTMPEVTAAALRMHASFLNVYPEDVMRAQPDQPDFDPAWQRALQDAAAHLGE